MLVVKIGGSVVTRRDAMQPYDSPTVRAIGAALGCAGEPLLIVHGMGSLGRSYLPLYDGRYLDHGSARVSYAIRREFTALHHMVLADLEDAGLPVRGIDTETVFAHRAGSITFSNLDMVRYHVRSGRVPVLPGGTFRDEDGRFAVLSSDEIAEALALEEDVRGLLWLTDVDGVLGSADGQVMPVLTTENHTEMMRREYDAADLTGGMTNKVRISVRLARHGRVSFVVNGREPERVRRLAAGKDAPCTIIR